MFAKSVRLTTIYSAVIDTVHVAKYPLPAVNIATKMSVELVVQYYEQGYTLLPHYLFLYCFSDWSRF
jgi:hypothetical protein